MTTPTPTSTTTAEPFTPTPAPPPSAHFHVAAHIRIHAPAALVFRLFTDPSTYPTWNAFVPSATVTPPSDPTATPCPTTPLQAGGTLHMRVRLHPPSPSLSAASCVVREIADPAATGTPGLYRAVWESTGMPAWALHSRRTTEVRALGDEECEFRSWEWFGGVLARVVSGVYPRAAVLQARFEETAGDIRGEAEKRVAAGGE